MGSAPSPIKGEGFVSAAVDTTPRFTSGTKHIYEMVARAVSVAQDPEPNVRTVPAYRAGALIPVQGAG